MRYSSAVLAGLLGLASAAPKAQPIYRRQTPTGACPTGAHVIASPGEGQVTQGNLDYLATLAYGVVDSIPGSDLAQTMYPQDGEVGTDLINYGENSLRQYLNDFSAACPNTKIILVGYSSGAVVQMNTLCGSFPDPPFTGEPALDMSIGKNIVASIVYGDLTYVPGQSYDLGTCGDSAAGLFPRPDPTTCDAYAPIMQSYCDVGDPECCAPGYDPNIHFEYPGIYDQQAIAFAVQQYNNAAGKV